MLHSRATLKIDDHNCILIFFKFGFFLIKDGFQKFLEIVRFVEKKIFYHLRHFVPQIIELWKRKSQNTVEIEKFDF
jgi:hypothetical protein